MNKRSIRSGAVAAALLWSLVAAATTLNAQPARRGEAAAALTSDADASLAHRFEEMARQMARGDSEAHVEQAAGWLRAAAESDPAEARYHRLLADAMLQLRDADGALAALDAYRKLRPGDQVAQLEVIDLYVARMETVDDKIAYLKDVAARDTIAAEVRSAAAARAAALMMEQGDRDAAVETIELAVSLNPVNPRALAMRYQTLPETASMEDRLATIFRMLQANPVQPELIRTVAETLADAGLLKEAATWYDFALRAVARSGQPLPPDLALDFAMQLFLNDQVQPARQWLDQLIEMYPEHYGALTARLLVERQEGGEKEVLEKLRVQARNALVNQLAVVRKELGAAEATTRPVNEGMLTVPDLGGDVERWRNAQDPELKDAYLQTVGDLAWFEVFFNDRPAEAEALLKHFNQLADENSPFAARTAGWVLLAQGKVDEAKVKLSAAAERDPLAALGLIEAYGKDEEEKAKTEAQQLLSSRAGGVLGAILLDRLKAHGASIAPGPNAEAIRGGLAEFPENWMRIIDGPSVFYALRGDPIKISFAYGEPMLARISIQNTSAYPITIGREGVVKPLSWIEAVPLGVFRDKIPPAALVERFTEQVVLKPRQGMTMVVRLDQGALLHTLMANPAPGVTLNGTVRTNVLTTNRGITPGPAGYAVEFARFMERTATPLSESMLRRRMDALTPPNGKDKVRTLSLLARYSGMLRAAKENEENQKMADELLAAVSRATNDPDPAVRAWAQHELVLMSEEAGREEVIVKMLGDPAWQSRALALHVIGSLPTERAKELVAPLAEREQHAVVKDLSAATLEVLDLPPTTQPTTQPAGAP